MSTSRMRSVGRGVTSTLNERLWECRDEDWWPEQLERGTRTWVARPVRMEVGLVRVEFGIRSLTDDEAHAFIGWRLLQWMADRHRVTLRGEHDPDRYVAGFGAMYGLKNKYDVCANSPIECLLWLYDQIK